MKAIARRRGDTYTHSVALRNHELTVDEPPDHGGEDAGPTPQELLAASLASCTAITLEMYANRKQWDLGPVEVECEYSTPERGVPTQFTLVMRLGRECTEDQLERLRTIAAKCPVHRTLQGEVSFSERIEPAPS
jgi:putative redox protein